MFEMALKCKGTVKVHTKILNTIGGDCKSPPIVLVELSVRACVIFIFQIFPKNFEFFPQKFKFCFPIWTNFEIFNGQTLKFSQWTKLKFSQWTNLKFSQWTNIEIFSMDRFRKFLNGQILKFCQWTDFESFSMDKF